MDLHGEYEAQPVFREDELPQVIATARVFYDWIIDGDDNLPDIDCPHCKIRYWQMHTVESLVLCGKCGKEPPREPLGDREFLARGERAGEPVGDPVFDEAVESLKKQRDEHY